MTARLVALKHYTQVPVVSGLNVAAGAGPSSWPRLIRTTDIVGPRTLSTELVRVHPSLVGDLDVRQGDVLFCRTGSLGTVYLASGGQPSAFAGYLVRVRPNKRAADPSFLGYWSESSHARLQIDAGAIRSTIDNFNARKVSNLRVPGLPLERQRAISRVLESRDMTLIALHERLDLLASTASDAWRAEAHGLIGFDRHPAVKIRYVAEPGTGHTPSRNHPEWWMPAECVIPWFTLADVHQIRDDTRTVVTDTVERITPLGLANSSAVLHPASTVLLSRTASVGFSGIMGRDMAVSQDFMTWTCGPKLAPAFLLYALRALRPELRRLMYGSTHKTIYMPDLLALRVPLPRMEEQRAAVARLDALSATHGAAMSSISQLRRRLAEYRAALITEAVTGQLDVTVASGRQMDEHMHQAIETQHA